MNNSFTVAHVQKELAFDFDIGRCSLRLANAVRDLARIESSIVRVNGTDDQRAVSFEERKGLEPRDGANGVVLAEPSDGKISRKSSCLTRHFELVAFQSRHV